MKAAIQPPKIISGLQKNSRSLLMCLLLALVTLAAFWKVNYADFVNFDDPVYVTENGNVQSGLTYESIRWAFSTAYADFWHLAYPGQDRRGNQPFSVGFTYPAGSEICSG